MIYPKLYNTCVSIVSTKYPLPQGEHMIYPKLYNTCVSIESTSHPLPQGEHMIYPKLYNTCVSIVSTKYPLPQGENMIYPKLYNTCGSIVSTKYPLPQGEHMIDPNTASVSTIFFIRYIQHYKINVYPLYPLQQFSTLWRGTFLSAILIRLQWANQLKQPTLVRRVQTTQ